MSYLPHIVQIEAQSNRALSMALGDKFNRNQTSGDPAEHLLSNPQVTAYIYIERNFQSTSNHMGSGLSCFWSRGSNRGKGFHPSCKNKGKENDSMRVKDYVARDDWLSADHGEIQALGHFSIKVVPSVLAEIDRRGGGGEFDCINHRGSAGTTTFERSKSGKTRKRVSFRLPEEDDIIMYNSPARGSTETLL